MGIQEGAFTSWLQPKNEARHRDGCYDETYAGVSTERRRQ